MPMWFYSEGKVPLILSYVANTTVVAGTTTYTFNFTFSPANSNRYLVAIVGWEAVSGTPLSESLTIGGISGTQIGTTLNPPGNVQYAVWSALVPTNTTQNAILTFARNGLFAACGLYDLENVSTLITSIKTNATTSQSYTATIVDGGAVLGGALTVGTTPTNSWSGITEDFDTLFNTHNSLTGAHMNFATGTTSLLITDTLGSTSLAAGGIVIFSP